MDGNLADVTLILDWAQFLGRIAVHSIERGLLLQM